VKSTELGREPYHSEVIEATERELAALAQKSGRRKVRKETEVEFEDAYKDIIAGLERRMDNFDQFVKSWEPKLRKWDSFIEELHEAHFASDKECGEAETRTDTIEKTTEKGLPEKGPPAEVQSLQSSSESESEESKSNSGTDHEEEGDEGEETEQPPATEVQQALEGSTVDDSSTPKVAKTAEVNTAGSQKKSLHTDDMGKLPEEQRGTASKSSAAVTRITESVSKKNQPTAEAQQVQIDSVVFISKMLQL
jgi:hypothetical protein